MTSPERSNVGRHSYRGRGEARGAARGGVGRHVAGPAVTPTRPALPAPSTAPRYRAKPTSATAGVAIDLTMSLPPTLPASASAATALLPTTSSTRPHVAPDLSASTLGGFGETGLPSGSVASASSAVSRSLAVALGLGESITSPGPLAASELSTESEPPSRFLSSPGSSDDASSESYDDTSATSSPGRQSLESSTEATGGTTLSRALQTLTTSIQDLKAELKADIRNVHRNVLRIETRVGRLEGAFTEATIRPLVAEMFGKGFAKRLLARSVLDLGRYVSKQIGWNEEEWTSHGAPALTALMVLNSFDTQSPLLTTFTAPCAARFEHDFPDKAAKLINALKTIKDDPAGAIRCAGAGLWLLKANLQGDVKELNALEFDCRGSIGWNRIANELTITVAEVKTTATDADASDAQQQIVVRIGVLEQISLAMLQVPPARITKISRVFFAKRQLPVDQQQVHGVSFYYHTLP